MSDRPTLVWRAGATEPVVIAAPAVDADGKPDPEDWQRYSRELAAAQDPTPRPALRIVQ